MRTRIKSYLGDEKYKNLLSSNKEKITNFKRSMIPSKKFDDFLPSQYYLIYIKSQDQFKLKESYELKKKNNYYTFGLDKVGKPSLLKVNNIYSAETEQIINLSTRFDYISLDSEQLLYRIDDELEIWEGCIDEIELGDKILVPREFNVIVNDNPIDLKECGIVYKIKNMEYITFGNEKIWKVPRFIEKSFELGFIIGQLISEGSMNTIDLTCGINEQVINEVYDMVFEIFGIKFNIYIEEKEDYKTLYRLRNESLLARSIFTKGMGLKPALAHQKEIPPFLYNAPIDCIKGFFRGFILGDASIKEQMRKGTNLRNIKVRLYTSSPRLVFGLNFLLKRLGIISNLEMVELSKKNPNWHDRYILYVHGKKNFNVLREFIPEIPIPKDKAPGKKCVINLSPWLKELNNELEEYYNTNFHNLYNNNLIQLPVYRFISQGKNISENYLLAILENLKEIRRTPPVFHKLYNIFRYNTIDIVNKIIIKNISHTVKRISTTEGNFISGLNQTYISYD